MLVIQIEDVSERYSYPDQKTLRLLLVFGQNDVFKLGCEVFLVDINTASLLSSKLYLPRQRRQNVQS